MAGCFQGFAQEGLNFLQQVRIENDKTWFEEHRFIYDRSILTPFRALVEDLPPLVLERDPQLEKQLADGFRQLEPLYQWLMAVETMKQVDPADL